jgi:non-specific serine/threonine protein kinase
MEALRDAHLIVSTAASNGELRFGMLETIREYALERLRDHGDEETVRHRHARYFGRFVELHVADPQRGLSLESAAALDRDYPNVRAALHWALDAGDAELAARFAGGLGDYWDFRGLIGEGYAWTARVLRLDAAPQPLLGRLRAVAAFLAYRHGQPEEAAVLAATVLADPTSAAADIIFADNAAGLAALDRGDLANARRHFEQLIRLAQEHGRLLDVSGGRANLGQIFLIQGQLAEAEALLQAAYAYQEAVQHRSLMGATSIGLGYIALLRDELHRAAALFRQSLQQLVSAGDTIFLLYALLACCALANRRNMPLQAAALFGAATHQAEQGEFKFDRALLGLLQAHVEQARAQTSPDEFEQALRRGQGMSLDEAVALARSLL